MVASWVFDLLGQELKASSEFCAAARTEIGPSGPGKRLLDASGFCAADLGETRRVTAGLLRRIVEGDGQGMDPPFVAGLCARLESLLERLAG